MNPNITSLIKAIYENVECAVVIYGQLTDLSKLEIGVRHGCSLSPILFNLFLEFVKTDVNK